MGSSIKDEKALSPKVDLVQDSFSSSASAKGKELEAAVNPAVDYVDEDSPALHAAHAKVDKRLVLWYAFVYLIMRIHVVRPSKSENFSDTLTSSSGRATLPTPQLSTWRKELG